MTSPIFDPEVEARRKARAEEYGVWEAAGVIEFGGARAFNEGDPVPVTTVERLNLADLGLVRKQSSKAATEAADARAEATADPGAVPQEDLEAQGNTTKTTSRSRTSKGGNA